MRMTPIDNGFVLIRTADALQMALAANLGGLPSVGCEALVTSPIGKAWLGQTKHNGRMHWSLREKIKYTTNTPIAANTSP